MYKGKAVSVVVPAFNEELLIADTLTSIPSWIDKIYLIDDCSRDNTYKISREIAKNRSNIVCFRHETNKGVGAAIVTGYKKALEDKMDVAVVMAGDNQMDPVYLPKFLDPIIAGKADYTKGNRLIGPEFRKGMSKWRYIGNTILTFLTKIASGYWQIVDPQNGYTAISGRALQNLDLDSIYPRYGYCNNMLARLNVLGLTVIDVIHPAKYGKERSKIKYGSYICKVSSLLLKDFLWRLKFKYIKNSFHPLIMFYIFGFAFAIIGLFGGIYSIYHKFVLSGALFERGVLSMVIFVFGLQFLLFAMVFDMLQSPQGIANHIQADTADPVASLQNKTMFPSFSNERREWANKE